MHVAQASLAAAQQVDFLFVLGHFAQELAGVGVEHGGTHGHLDDLVLAVGAVWGVLAAALAVGGEDMTPVTQREQRPQMTVAP